MRSIVDVMVESGKVEIGGVFGPEHGFRGTAQAGEAEDKDGFTSGVGLDKIAQQHGMTAGELARFYNGEFMPRVAGRPVQDLAVVQVQGWSPGELFADTGAPWIMPSPNLPTPDTALLYPGLGMFEATNLSEGRGTTRPFELIGAPYVDYRWAQRLSGEQLPGVEFREAYFNPTFSKNEGKVCGGVQVHIADPQRVDAIRTATTMMTTLRDLYAEFDWRGDAGRWINLLTGSVRFLRMFAAGDSAAQIVAAWQPELRAFDRTRRQYLLYKR
nr:DUF1343 domain-containing protein [Flexivirga aerilata]